MSTWTSDDGLPQNSVTSIVQTPYGYLWMGTFSGLVRFDGVRFATFDSANTPALASSRIIRLFLDRNHALWITSEFGDLARMAGGEFTRFSQADGLPSSGVGLVAEDASGRIWISPRRNEGCFSFDDGRFSIRVEPRMDMGATFGFLTYDADGNLWAKNRYQLVKIFPGDPVLVDTPAMADGKPEGLQSIAMSRDGGLWIGYENSLVKYRGGRWEKPWRFPKSVSVMGSMYEDRAGRVWLGTWDQGLFVLDLHGDVRSMKLLPTTQQESVRCVFEDREGSFWIGTDGIGLFRLKRRAIRTLGPPDGLSSQIVKSVTEDRDGTIWVVNNSRSMRAPAPRFSSNDEREALMYGFPIVTLRMPASNSLAAFSFKT